MVAAGRPLGNLVIKFGLDGAQFMDSLKNIQRAVKQNENAMKSNLKIYDAADDQLAKLANKYKDTEDVMKTLKAESDKLNETYQQQIKDGKENTKYHQTLAKQINDNAAKQAMYTKQLKDTKLALDDEKRGTQDLKDQLDLSQRSTTANISKFESLKKTLHANKAEYSGLRDQIKLRNDIMDKEKQKLQDLISLEGKDSSAVRKQRTALDELESAQTKAQSRYDKLSRSVGHSSGVMLTAREHMSKASASLKNVGDKFTSAGQSMIGATLGIGGAFVYGAKQAVAFQNKMIEIKNLLVTGGESAADASKGVKQMSSDAKKYASQYGISVHNIADGYEELVKKGYSSQQSLGSMKSLLQASKASGDDFNEVVHVSTSTLEQFGLRTKSTAGMLANTKRVTNALAYAADMTSTNFHDAGKAMEYVGGTAHQAQWSLETTSAAIVLLSNKGLEADKAGTGLRKMMTSIISPTDKAYAALKQLGVHIKDKNGALMSLPNIIDQFQSKLSKYKPAQRVNFLHVIFGQTGQEAAGDLITAGGKALQELSDKAKKAEKTNYVGTLSDKNMKSAQNQMARFRESIKVLSMDFSNTLLPTITKVVKGLSNLLSRFDKMSPSAKKFWASIGAGVAVAGPLLIAIGAVFKSVSHIINGINMLTTAFNFLKTAIIANPIGAVIVGITALSIGLYELYKHNAKFRAFVNGIGADIKAGFGATIKWLKGAWNGTGKFFSNLWHGISSGVSGFVSGVHKKWASMVSGSKSRFNDMKKTTVKLAGDMADQVMDKNSWLNKHSNGAFKDMFNGLKKVSKNGFNAMKDYLNIFKDFFTGHWGNLGKDFKKLANDAWKTVKSSFKSGFNVLNDVTSGALGKLWKGVKSIGGNIVSFFKKLPGRMADGIKAGAKDLANAGIYIGNSLIKSVQDVIQDVEDGINWVLKKIGMGKEKLPIAKLPKIPYFANGTVDSYGRFVQDSLVHVGDGNKTELIKHADGSIEKTPNRDTLTIVRKGDSILGGDKTEQLLKMMPHFSIGSFFGSVGSFIKGGWGKLQSGAEAVYNDMTHPTKLLNTVIEKLSGSMLGKLSGVAAKLASGTIKTLVSGAGKWLGKQLGGAGNPKGSNVDRWKPVIEKAAAASGIKLRDGDMDLILNRIKKESGGNPTILQKVVDINSKEGHPAQGLLQYIPSTFAAWAVKPYTDILKGYDQIRAMFNNTNWRSDIAAPGGWGPTGTKRFAKGGQAFGPSLVGEENKQELIRLSDGSMMLSPNRATLYNFKQPADILGGDKTERLLKLLPHFANGTTKEWVDGYTRSDGVKVKGYWRTVNDKSSKKKAKKTKTRKTSNAARSISALKSATNAIRDKIRDLRNSFENGSLSLKSYVSSLTGLNKARGATSTTRSIANSYIRSAEKKSSTDYSKRISDKITAILADYRSGKISAKTEKSRLDAVSKNNKLSSQQRSRIESAIGTASKQTQSKLTQINNAANSAVKTYSSTAASLKKTMDSTISSLKKTMDSAVSEAASTRDSAISDAQSAYQSTQTDNVNTAYSSFGLFDKASQQKVSGTGLLRNLQSQNSMYQTFVDNINKLKARGASNQLINELLQQGISANSAIEALLQLPESDWNAYQSAYSQKSSLSHVLGQTMTDNSDAASTMNSAIQTATDTYNSAVKNATDAYNSGVAKAQATYQAGIKKALTTLEKTLTADKKKYATKGLDVGKALASAVNKGISGLDSTSKKTISKFVKTLTPSKTKTVKIGHDTVEHIVSGLNHIKSKNSAVKSVAKTMQKYLKTSKKGNLSIGYNTIQGMIDGLESQRGALEAKAKSLAKSVENTIRKALKIHSPSQVGHELMGFFGQGLANGLYASFDTVKSAASAVSNLITDSINPSATLPGPANNNAQDSTDQSKMLFLMQQQNQFLFKIMQSLMSGNNGGSGGLTNLLNQMNLTNGQQLVLKAFMAGGSV